MGSVIRRPNSIRKNRWGGGGSFSRVKKERERNDKSGGRGDDEEKDERVGKREKGNRNGKKISALQRGSTADTREGEESDNFKPSSDGLAFTCNKAF